MSQEKISILFQPSGRRGEVETGKTILEAARELGVVLESVCGGKFTCGKCRVRIDPRPSPPGKEIFSPFTPEEAKFISEDERNAGYRLACAARLSGDASVYLPEESRGFQQVIRKEAGEISVDLNPAIKCYYLELPPPTLEEPLADLERLLRGLSAAHGLNGGLRIDYPALQALPQRLRAADWKVSVLVWMDREIIDLHPGKVEEFYGAAVDIGTTTVALYLCSLKTGRVVAAGSMMNPQVNYGEDVMARITYCMMNPGEGLALLKRAIVDGLNGLIQSTAASAGLQPEDLLEITVVGNTAMHHLFLGIEPEPLGLSPFAPAVHRSLDMKARDVGLKVHPSANVHLLPIEAGFVGADNVGVLIAEEPYRRDEMNLIIDVGTNGELILGNRRRLLSSSCATGPAFEGAHIRFGMRAAPGAIEKVRILPDLEVRYKVIGKEGWSGGSPSEELRARGICGSGIIDAVAEMFRAGILDKSGRMDGSLPTPRLRKAERGFEFVLAWAGETAIGQEITVSTPDVRAVQLAKGALYSGAKIMMKTLGVDRVDRVVLAGGFGSYIDPERAMILGMFPDCDLARVVSAGNAAGDGARMALLSREKREEAERVAREVEYVELTVSPDFTAEFAEAMAFPHQRDPFPHLDGLLKRGKVK